MSSSRPRPNLSIFLVLSEAVWLTLCFSAIVNTWPHFSMDVPYPALALPATAAVVLGWNMKRSAWSARQKAALLAPAALVMTALAAGAISELSVSGSFVTVAFTPWAATGRVASATSTDAWFVASLAVGRGLEVGLVRSTFGQTIRSVVIAALAFFILFVSVATEPSVRLAAATRLAEPALFIYFLVALALLRLSRALNAEGSATTRAIAPATGVWSAMLMVPLLLVALVAFAVAAALGSWGTHVVDAARDILNAMVWFFSEIGRGIAFVVVHVVDGIVALIEAVIHLFTHHGLAVGGGQRSAPVTTTTIAPATIVHHHIPLSFTVGLVVSVITAMAIVAHRLRQAPKRHAVPLTPGAEMTASTFTWRRLLAQILELLRHALASLWKRVAHRGPAPLQAHGGNGPAPEGVRHEYLRLLVAARTSGLGREPTETPAEFAERIIAALGDEELSKPVGLLTMAYETARYSERDPDPAARDAAMAAIDTVVLQLMAFAEAVARQAAESAEAELTSDGTS